MFDYCEWLKKWRLDQQALEKTDQNKKHLPNVSNQCYAEISDKNTIIVTMGDSWTWGYSLDSELRYQQVYGAILKQNLDCDWINIGCPGFPNSWILDHLETVSNLLQDQNYKKIIFIITLTENGRDTGTLPVDYNDIVKAFGISEKFYEHLLTITEMYWINQIKSFLQKKESKIEIIIGQNFVWHDLLAHELEDQVKILELNWIECLADAQNLPRPIRTNLVTNWMFASIDSVHKIVQATDKSAFKSWTLSYTDRALKVNEWLDSSPMNYDGASKHPNAEAHKVWADYILQHL